MLDILLPLTERVKTTLFMAIIEYSHSWPSWGRVLFPSLCHGCARLCRIVCIDMMTFTVDLYAECW